MRLHMLGLYYTLHSQEYSPDPFSGKLIRFPKMMKDEGFHIIEYCNEGSESSAKEKITILDGETFRELRKLHDETEAPGKRESKDSTLFREFDKKLIEALKEKVKPHEIICHTYGSMHAHFRDAFPENFHIETGVGYTGVFSNFRVYESYAWWHWHQGRENRSGQNYEWVIPMFYDLAEWEPCYTPGEYILYFGRVVKDKGLDIVREVAARTNREVIICGEGDASPWLLPDIPNLKYMPPVRGHARNELLRNAYCMLAPTTYTEPFGSSAVEAMLCGTPVIASDFGGFTETVEHGLTGYRCKTLGDWLYGVKMAGKMDRKTIAEVTRAKYGMETIAPKFTRVFEQLHEMKNQGWYCHTPYLAIP